MEKEIRSIPQELAEIRIAPIDAAESRRVEGYGVVFNSESNDLGGFTEVILPSAVNGVIEKSDVLALVNHSIDKGVLARSTKGQGSMSLTVDQRGVKYSFDAPKYNLGDELLEGIKRGDIRGSSFAFTVGKDGQKIERKEDGKYLRIITQFDQIMDMSPCYQPAYNNTDVARRSLDEFKEQIKDEPVEEEVKAIVEEPIVEPIVETKIEEFKMSDEERYLYQKNKLLKLRNNDKIGNTGR